jgi:hypothetical protein
MFRRLRRGRAEYEPRLELAGQTLEQLETLRTRVAQIEAELRERSTRESALQARGMRAEADLAATQQELQDLIGRVSATEEAYERERKRGDAAEAQASAGIYARAELEGLLAERTATLERLRAQLEQERVLRAQAEQDAARLREDADTHPPAPLWKQITAQLDLLEGLAHRVEQALNRLPSLRLVPPPTEPEEQAEERHLCFLPAPSGHELIELDGPPPALGAVVDLGDDRLGEVVKLAGSPLPRDRRRCAYLLLIARPSPTTSERHDSPAPADSGVGPGSLEQDGPAQSHIL